jgi:hypothetical protein
MYKITLIKPLYEVSTKPIFNFFVENMPLKYQDNFIVVEAKDSNDINKKLIIPISNIKVIIEL